MRLNRATSSPPRTVDHRAISRKYYDRRDNVCEVSVGDVIGGRWGIFPTFPLSAEIWKGGGRTMDDAYGGVGWKTSADSVGATLRYPCGDSLEFRATIQMAANTCALSRNIHYSATAIGMAITRIADWPYVEISGRRPTKSAMVYANGVPFFRADASGIPERLA